jgi:hypothetical protein
MLTDLLCYMGRTWRKLGNSRCVLYELGTVLSSNLPLPLWLFLNLYRLITPDLILKLNTLKSHLGIPNFKDYEKWYHKRTE